MKLRPTLKKQELQQITARDFGGGLDLVDPEFNLASRYAVAGYNMVYGDNGDLSVRWGTRKFADLSSVLSSNIVGMEYYYQYLIVVDVTGRIASVNASGVATLIWSPEIAATKPGAPSGWSTTLRPMFAQFLGSLIVVNGVDKPIIMDNALNVQYLQDLGSGSNIHVPIAKLIIAHSNYVVMAGDPNKPGRLYISNAGTSGTWTGDPLPNDAITFDVDKYAPDSTGEITALASFRDRLVVFFSRYIVTLKLGVYNEATPPVHQPVVDDILASYGAVSQRSVANLGDSLIFMDYTGVSSVKQATLTNTLTPERISTLVDLDIQRALSTLSRSTLQDLCFSTYDRREGRVMFFVPQSAGAYGLDDMKVYALTLKKSRPSAWSIFTKWNFRTGAVSSEGRVFFGVDRKLYLHGSKYEPILTDYENDKPYDGPSSELNRVYVGGILCDTTTLGQGIPFYHELPYNELRDRTKWKTLHYVTQDTQGASSYTLELYVDGLKNKQLAADTPWSDGWYFDDNKGWAAEGSVPYATMSFIGGDRTSMGLNPTLPTPARLTDDMRLYAMYGRFRFFKFAFRGTSYSHLRIVALSIYFSTGSIY